MFLVTYDEHGGFWDSVPPTASVENPHPENPGYPEKFNFDRLGPRVPAIAVSPWLAASVDSKYSETLKILHFFQRICFLIILL